MAVLEVNPFAPGEVFDWMWGANGGTHASAQWQTNGNDLYAAPGARVVAPITGTIVRVGEPPIGEGVRVGIQGATHAVYMAHLVAPVVRNGDHVHAGAPIARIDGDQAFPPHLHFSIAAGDYDQGPTVVGRAPFVDPHSEVIRTAEHVAGRTYRVPKIAPAPPDEGFWLEALPWDPATDLGTGPRVLGPWSSQSGRDEWYEALKAAGKIVTKHGQVAPGRFYVFQWRRGTYGLPYVRRFDTRAKRDAAYRALPAGDRVYWRRYRGRDNSVYPNL